MMTAWKCKRMELQREVEYLCRKAEKAPSAGLLIAIAKRLLLLDSFACHADFGLWRIELGYHEDEEELVVVSPTWDRWHVRYSGVYRDRY